MKMDRTEYLKKFFEKVEKIKKVTEEKNKDYANDGDAFQNFRQIEFLTDNKITLEEGVLVRMTDKMSRISNLLYKSNDVKDESITDTLDDLAVYSLILSIYLSNKGK